MNRLLSTFILLAFFTATFGQSISSFGDSIHIKYKIPELAYAVVSSDSILEIQVVGVQRVNSEFKANINDRFRIGSNTITSYISAVLVKKGKIKWDTKFFDLFPELKTKSLPAYHDLTLKNLLTLRAPIMSWTYTYQEPTEREIKGNTQEQRYNFASWILKQDPIVEQRTFYWSNPSYVLAGLMLEKATGKIYDTLVNELGHELGIEFGFGQPNFNDKNQPWGHNENLVLEKPSLNYKLNWLSPAGNINVSLPDYSKFIQLQLRGLSGKSQIFTKEEFEYMHYGLPEFSMGWRWYVDSTTNLRYSYHEGNPGTFLTKTFICNDTGKAFIIFANVQSEEAQRGMIILLDELKRKYGS
jgi:CubicO group peptidase (beta-lactamase class C family)